MGEQETQRVLNDVANERSLQRGRWGDEFDDKLSDAWWGNMLGSYVGRVQSEIFNRGEKPTDEAALRYVSEGDAKLRADLIKVAAIAVCYAEVIDRRGANDNS